MWPLLLACVSPPAAEPPGVDGALAAPQELDLAAVALAALDTSEATTMDRINHVHDLLVSVEAPGTDPVFSYLSHLVLWNQSVADVSQAILDLDEDLTSEVNGIRAELDGDGSAWSLLLSAPEQEAWVNTSAVREEAGWVVSFYDPYGSGALAVRVVRSERRAEVEYAFEGTRLVSSTDEPQTGSFDSAEGHEFDFALEADGSGWMKAWCPLDGVLEVEATLTGASSGEVCVADTACCDDDNCDAGCFAF